MAEVSLTAAFSTVPAAFTITSPLGLVNSEIGICPSDLHLMSTTA